MNEIKLAIGIPTIGLCRTGFAYSLAGLIGYIAAKGITTLPDCKVDAMIDCQESTNLLTNREQLVARAIERGKTHLMFLDEDMIFQPKILDLLAGRRHPVVCVNYLIKTDPPSQSEFVAVSLTGKRIPTRPEDTGIVPIAYSGFGVSLFDLEVFKKAERPWFLPKFHEAKSEYTTEDNPCYEKIRKAGFDVYLDHDASKLVSHVGNKAWNWSEWRPRADVVVMKDHAEMMEKP